MPNKNESSNTDLLRSLEKFTEWTARGVNTVADGIDTGFTPIRVFWQLFPEFLASYLWTLPAVISNAFIVFGFGLLFPVRDYYQRQRKQRIFDFNYVTSQLIKTFQESLKNDHWSEQKIFYGRLDLEIWYKACGAHDFFYKLLQVKTDKEVLAILHHFFQKQTQAKKPVTLKSLLAWLPVYIASSAPIAATNAEGYTALAATDDDEETSDSTEIEYNIGKKQRLKLIKKLYDKRKLSIAAPAKPGKNDVKETAQSVLWGTPNQYTMWYWIVKSILTVFNKPTDKGALVPNTTPIFLLALIGPVSHLAYLFFNTVRKIRDWLSPSKNPQSDKIQYETLDDDQKKIVHQMWFAKYLSQLERLKAKLHYSQTVSALQKNLKKQHSDTAFNDINKANISDNEFKELASSEKEKQMTLLQTIQSNTEKFAAQYEQITAKTIKDKFATNKPAAVIVRSTIWFSTIFAQVSFIIWVTSEILGYTGHIGTLINAAKIPAALAFLGGPQIAFIGAGISAGLGLIAAVIAGINTYQTYSRMEKDLQNHRSNREIAQKANELNRLKAEVQALQLAEKQMIEKNRNCIGNANLEINESLASMQTELPDFAQTEAINNRRLREILSFKYTITTGLKKLGNGLLTALVGGITGSLLVRVGIFSISAALAATSFGVLITVNPVAAAVLGGLLLGGVVLMAAAKLWNHHLNRIEEDQKAYLKEAGTSRLQLLEKQVKICKTFIQKAKSNIASLIATKKIITEQKLTFPQTKKPIFLRKSSKPPVTTSAATLNRRQKLSINSWEE